MSAAAVNFYADHLDHMVEGMARIGITPVQAIKDYVWDKAQALAAADPLVYEELPARLVARVEELKAC